MPQHSPLSSPSATIAALQRWGLYTKKPFGQHFLVDDGVLGKVLGLAAQATELPVLEVGPGIGTLTEALLIAGYNVTAVELDLALEPVLADIALRYPGRFSFMLADALALQPADLPSSFDMVSNLPYSVAATVILDAFQRFDGLRSATVMVQREVAERIMAAPGSKAYGAYSVKLALLAQPSGSFSVSSTSFLPPPRVQSTVLRLDRREGPEVVNQPDWERARLLIDAAFGERRKTLRNSLKSNLANYMVSSEQIDGALAASAIDGSRRAEQLTVEEYRLLARALPDINRQNR